MLQILSLFLSLIIYLPFINADTTDQCAIVMTNVPIGPGATQEFIGCLCKDGIADAIAKDPTLNAFATVVGEMLAEEILDSQIDDSPTEQVCRYPEDAIPQCTFTNLCAFTCGSGKTLCSDGKCKKNCPSADVDINRRDQLPMPTPASRCPGKQEMCRIGKTFKCIDTQNSLVYCGGCPQAKLSKRGKDCSEIEGADFVSCRRGVCDVESCLKDYSLDPESGTCSLDA